MGLTSHQVKTQFWDASFAKDKKDFNAEMKLTHRIINAHLLAVTEIELEVNNVMLIPKVVIMGL